MAHRSGSTNRVSCEMARAVDAIGDIDDPPISLQTKTILAAITGAAAVIDVENRKAAACPILRPPAERRGGGGGRAAVAMHDQRRQLAVRGRKSAVPGRVEQAISLQPVVRVECYRLRHGETAAIDVHILCCRELQDSGAAGAEIQLHDAGRRGGRAAAKIDEAAIGANRRDVLDILSECRSPAATPGSTRLSRLIPACA